MSHDAVDEVIQQRQHLWAERLQPYIQRAQDKQSPIVEGMLKRVVGLTMEAVGCQAAVGSHCLVETTDGSFLQAEVVGFSGEKLLLMPTGNMQGVMPNARVIPMQSETSIPVGEGLLGRVIDAAGKPLDGKGALDNCDQRRPLQSVPINPLSRRPIREPLDVGVRAINAMLSVGRGQRMGLFAGSGVGKSVLLGMMTRYTEADIIVVGLIGERGREVKEFVENILGEEGLSRSVVVATPADQPPLMRLRAAWLCTSIAEHFRDQGKQVLLLMDSLTRFAQAQREISLAVGEPPATKGYPPSVFAKLPQLVERAGNGDHGGGSITAFYTVLAEGDDQNDPIVDSARAILDGHIVLTRKLADAGQYPAIDIEQSISRAFNDITDKSHQDMVRHFKQIYANYQRNRDLITIGAYQRGTDPRVDQAIQYWPLMSEFLGQTIDESVTYDRSLDELGQLMQGEHSTIE